MLTLFYAPKACSLAPHILLEESGLPYRAELVDIFAGEHLRPEYLKLNPRGRVPALRLESGEILTEVTSLLFWISEQVPERGFLPASSVARARCIELASLLASWLHPAFAQIVRPDRYLSEAVDHPRISAMGVRAYLENLALLNTMLSPSGPFAMGEHFTMCDPYVLVFARWANDVGLDIGGLQRIRRCVEHTMARTAVRRTLEVEGLLEASEVRKAG
jgi:glutathione S-transferase